MDNKEIVTQYLNALDIEFEIKSLEDITKLMKAHLSTFAFSGLKVLLDEEISLNLSSIYNDIVIKKRGGYCFEHNKLFYEVLKELGFDVTPSFARIINNTETIPPKTHRFTILKYKKVKYLIDLGIGFRTPSNPIKFGSSSTISHLDIEFKITENNDKTFSMEMMENSSFFKVTKFDFNRYYEADFEMGHFYSYKNPNAVFVNNFVISRIEENKIYSIINDKYFNIYKDKIVQIIIGSIEQFEQIIHNDFNLNFTSKEIEYFYENFILFKRLL